LTTFEKLSNLKFLTDTIVISNRSSRNGKRMLLFFIINIREQTMIFLLVMEK